MTQVREKQQFVPGEGIVFQGSFADSFMYHATNEGFATPLHEQDDIFGEILTRYRRARKRTEALELCLIYDKVFLYAFDDEFDLGCLQDEGLIDHIYPTSPARYYAERDLEDQSPYLSQQDLPTLRLLKPVILPHLRRKYRFLNSVTYDTMLAILASEEFVSFMRHGKALPSSLARDLVPMSFTREEADWLNSVLPLTGSFHREQVMNRIQERIGLTGLLVLFMYDDLIQLLDLLQRSSEISVPIATPLIARSSRQTLAATDLVSQESLNICYRVFQVVVSEIEFFPVVDSIADILRLREDRRIIDFRENLNRWATALRSGDVAEEEKLREEIRKSNRALRSIDPWKKTGAYLTYLALPLSIVPVLGLPLTALSIAIQIYVDAVEWRNRWLMVGR